MAIHAAAKEYMIAPWPPKQLGLHAEAVIIAARSSQEEIAMSPAQDPAAFALRKLLQSGAGEMLEPLPWADEESRWFELVFSLFAAVSDAPEGELRALVGTLASLELITVEALVSSPETAVQRAVDEAIAAGIDATAATAALGAATEAANVLAGSYGGKMQLLLREEGEALLRNITEKLGISALDQGAVGHALTYWLQNTLNLPLSLRDRALQEFAGRLGVSVQELVSAADSLDLNVALIDDLIRYQHADSRSLE
jgi:hypothetical protein